jgi:hypothetical protein
MCDGSHKHFKIEELDQKEVGFTRSAEFKEILEKSKKAL